jgi:hypothetical protein
MRIRHRANQHIYHTKLTLLLSMLLGLSVLAACSQHTRLSSNSVPTVADLQVVDCLLPGEVRRLGSSIYQTPRLPTLTTAANCRIRGGEYTEYDRADYKTALAVWMPQAEQGDAEAQVNVGEIFERGLGDQPNYEAAAIWYQRAAEQGNSRGQFNLGTLYEQGLGVEQNKLQALNLYRQAWDLPVDSVMFQSAADEAQRELRNQLEQSIQQKDTQIRALNRQINELQQQLAGQNNQALREELDTLRSLVNTIQDQRVDDNNQLVKLREPSSSMPARIETPWDAPPAAIKDMEFGKYYALVIGNQNYLNIDDLDTPHRDAQRAKEILESQFGFKVTVLLDADNIRVMQAINELNEVVTDKDNLLIFYAGHGSRIQTGNFEAGYWLPTNALPPPNDTYWVSNEFVTRHLARIKAKRVIVVADSCYAGLLSEEPGYLLLGDQGAVTEEYVRYKMPKRARLLLSSGGDQPVLDGAGEGNSVFAKAFLDVLESAGIITSAPELFLKVRESVEENSTAAGFTQVPEFKVIKGAGHEVGDFFFVRQKI